MLVVTILCALLKLWSISSRSSVTSFVPLRGLVRAPCNVSVMDCSSFSSSSVSDKLRAARLGPAILGIENCQDNAVSGVDSKRVEIAGLGAVCRSRSESRRDAMEGQLELIELAGHLAVPDQPPRPASRLQEPAFFTTSSRRGQTSNTELFILF